MRELVVVLADLHWHSEQPLVPVDPEPAFRYAPTVRPPRPLRFAPSRAVRGGWRGELARRLGLGRLHGTSLAELLEAGWLATPVALEAGLTDVRLPSEGLLALDEAEQRALVADFNRAFADAPALRLERRAPDLLALHGLRLEADATEPARWLGMTLHDALPGGPGGAQLRAVGAEIEMWLHGWSWNERRRARGLRPVAGLWLWGREPLLIANETGAVPHRAVAPALDRVWSAPDAFVDALAQQAGSEVAPLPADVDALLRDDALRGWLVLKPLVSSSDAAGVAGALVTRVSQWLDPLFDALAAGALGSLELIANDRAVHLSARDRLRLWRPARTWLEALA